jgi:hypothetical protein
MSLLASGFLLTIISPNDDNNYILFLESMPCMFKKPRHFNARTNAVLNQEDRGGGVRVIIQISVWDSSIKLEHNGVCTRVESPAYGCTATQIYHTSTANIHKLKW